MKTLKESLLDIDKTSQDVESSAIETGIRTFIKKIIKTGFPHRLKEIDDSEIILNLGLGGYTVSFNAIRFRSVVLDEGYTIPEDLWEIHLNDGAVYYTCFGDRADCTILNKINTKNHTFELISMGDEVTWANFQSKRLKFTPTTVAFECETTPYNSTAEHKFENCDFGGVDCITYDNADLRDVTEPVPGYTKNTSLVVGNCILGKNTAYELVKAGIEGCGDLHAEFTKDRIIVPEFGEEIKLYDHWFSPEVVKGIRARIVRGVHVDNLKHVDPKTEIVEVHTVDTIDIKRNPLTFVPRIFLLGPAYGVETNNQHFYKIKSLNIECEKFVDGFHQPDLLTFSSKHCKYINTITDVRMNWTLSKLINSQPSSYKDLDSVINIKNLPNLKYISFSDNGRTKILQKIPDKPFWVVMSESDANRVREEYDEIFS